MKELSRGGRTNGVPIPQLAFFRKRAGLSQKMLAEQASISRQTVNRLEQGANARYETIKRLAQALNVPPARLVRERPERLSQPRPRFHHC